MTTRRKQENSTSIQDESHKAMSPTPIFKDFTRKHFNTKLALAQKERHEKFSHLVQLEDTSEARQAYADFEWVEKQLDDAGIPLMTYKRVKNTIITNTRPIREKKASHLSDLVEMEDCLIQAFASLERRNQEEFEMFRAKSRLFKYKAEKQCLIANSKQHDTLRKNPRNSTWSTMKESVMHAIHKRRQEAPHLSVQRTVNDLSRIGSIPKGIARNGTILNNYSTYSKHRPERK